MSSIEYYNQNAKRFVDRTISVGMQHAYDKFLPHLPKGAKILDAGCGSGRDTLHFKKQGFDVVAFDASVEMVKNSTSLTGSKTLLLNFQDIAFREEFDAVWASASLLHVPYHELTSVFEKLHLALKLYGILYATFKHGDCKREDDNRIFYDMNETLILNYITPFFTAMEIWSTIDTRGVAVSPSRSWLHILARKS